MELGSTQCSSVIYFLIFYFSNIKKSLHSILTTKGDFKMIQNFTKNAIDKIMFAVLSLAAIVLFGALDGMPHCGPSMFFFGEPEYPNLDEEIE